MIETVSFCTYDKIKNGGSNAELDISVLILREYIICSKI